MPAPATFLERHWREYPPRHRDRVNLLVHIVAVPIFVAGILLALAALITGQLAWLATGLAAAALSIGAQGVTHRREQTPPEPFQGPLDVLRRIFAEQFVTFWRFVGTGLWWKQLQGG